MRRLIGILCLSCYLASALSLSVAVSYCDDKITGFSLYAPKDIACCCDDQLENDCCGDDIINLDKTDDHYFHAQGKKTALPASLLSLYVPGYVWRYVHPPIFCYSDDIDPPPVLFRQLYLYIFHLVLRI